MNTTRHYRLFLTSFLLAVCAPSAIAQQGNLARRFSEDSFRRGLRINMDTPMFANESEAKAYRDYRGEWKWESSTGVSYDSNAFQDASNLEDWRWNYGVTLAYEWWTSEDIGIVITPSLGFNGQRFDRYAEELDGDMLNTGLNITFDQWSLKPALTYNIGWVFTPGYDEHNYTEQTLGLEFGHKYSLLKAADGTADGDGPTLAWKLSGGHVFAAPEEFTANQAAFGLESEIPLTGRLALLLNAGTGFRDYTKDAALGRDTWTFNTGAALAWTFYKKERSGEQACTLLLGTTYYHAADRLPGLDAAQFTVYLALKFAWEGFHFLGLPGGSR